MPVERKLRRNSSASELEKKEGASSAGGSGHSTDGEDHSSLQQYRNRRNIDEVLITLFFSIFLCLTGLILLECKRAFAS